MYKMFQYVYILVGMSYFRVELYVIEVFFFVSYNGKWVVFGVGYGDEVGWNSGNFIVVVYLDIEQWFIVCGQCIFDIVNQCVVVYDFNLCVVKFMFVRGFNVIV